ncbi:hypothetical protein NT01EI_2619 [Edwardsiella ictaluri 93-146]|uniref:Uncharacterized protein n=1 Tax=Edwardsiella ictaluri (strain 93-146) TaxID=634503 RepID=C5BG64_EDWI9|nr:hypothetical protein NT01EI_2619 [Edwardsiella ictaluri 93-146]
MVIPSPKRRQCFLLTFINKIVNPMFVKKDIDALRGVNFP